MSYIMTLKMTADMDVAAILENGIFHCLDIKSLIDIANMCFTGFLDPKNISLYTKCAFLAGLSLRLRYHEN